MKLPLLSFKMLANTAFSWRNQHPKHSRSPSKGSSFPGRQIVEGNPPTGSELHVKPKNKIMGAAWAFNAIKVLYGYVWVILDHFCTFCHFCLVWQFVASFHEKWVTRQKDQNKSPCGRYRSFLYSFFSS